MTTPHLALIALDLTDGDPVAVEAMLSRLAQVIRHGTEREGVTVGDVRVVVVPDLTAENFFAALAAQGTR